MLNNKGVTGVSPHGRRTVSSAHAQSWRMLRHQAPVCRVPAGDPSHGIVGNPAQLTRQPAPTPLVYDTNCVF